MMQEALRCGPLVGLLHHFSPRYRSTPGAPRTLSASRPPKPPCRSGGTVQMVVGVGIPLERLLAAAGVGVGAVGRQGVGEDDLRGTTASGSLVRDS